MLETALTALGASPLARALAASRYLYPLVNAAHIMALATLFGSIVALDLRLLGAFAQVPVRPLARLLPRVAAGGLTLAILTGFLLFTVQPLDYAGNIAFRTKLSLVAIGTAHALYVHGTGAWRALLRDGAAPGPGLRISAAASLLLWSGAILAGRLIAFE